MLVDCYGGDEFRTKGMSEDGYSKAVKRALTDLGVHSKKLKHLGRNLGAKQLEMLGVSQDDINAMGQWFSGMQKTHYSTHLPFNPMRRLAGYAKSNESYYNKRTVVKCEDKELLMSTPFGFAENALPYIDHLNKHEDAQLYTAYHFLSFMVELNQVLVQDAAAMMVLDPERCEKHPFFKMKWCQSANFQHFVERMKQELTEDQSPLDANVEQVLPGVKEKMTELTKEIMGIKTTLKEGFQKMEDVRAEDQKIYEARAEETKEMIA